MPTNAKTPTTGTKKKLQPKQPPATKKEEEGPPSLPEEGTNTSNEEDNNTPEPTADSDTPKASADNGTSESAGGGMEEGEFTDKLGKILGTQEKKDAPSDEDVTIQSLFKIVHSLSETVKELSVETKRLSASVSVYVDLYGNLEDIPEMLIRLEGLATKTSEETKATRVKTTEVAKGVLNLGDYIVEHVNETVDLSVKKSRYEHDSNGDQPTQEDNKTFKVSLGGPEFPDDAPGG